MGTHWMIFLTIGNLVSPPSFSFAGQVKGRTGPPPPNNRSVLSRLLKPGVCCLARVTYETRCLLIGGASIRRFTNCLSGPRLRWLRDRFVAQLFFGSNPVLDIFSVFAAALKIQLMSQASDLFSQWFSQSNHCNLLGCQYGAGVPTDLRISDVDYLPFAEMLIFICFGLDSSRFAICRVKTPLRYSARMLSELTVFGSEKLRVNGP
jgi:hypothetical protein